MAKSKNKGQKDNGIDPVLLPVVLPSKRGRIEGRKPAIDMTALERLREAFLLGCDDEEAASYAEISRQTLYNHQKANPAFLDWKEALKQRPYLAARKTIVKELQHNPQFALAYMERKKKAEFSPAAKLTIDDTRKLDDEPSATIGNSLFEHITRQQQKRDKQNAANSGNANQSADD